MAAGRGVVGERFRDRLVTHAVGVATCTLLLLSATAAGAHDHEIPSPRLFRGADLIQRLRIVHSCWVHPVGDDGWQAKSCTDHPWSFPRRDGVRAGRVLTVRLGKRQQPEALTLTSYGERRSDGSPSGPAQRIATILEPKMDQAGAVVGYWVKFSLTPDRHFLVLKARWPDENEPDMEQSAEWTMNLRARG